MQERTQRQGCTPDPRGTLLRRGAAIIVLPFRMVQAVVQAMAFIDAYAEPRPKRGLPQQGQP